MKLAIGHMYADHLNLYGDRGNIIALANRARGRNLEVEVTNIPVGKDFDFSALDIVFIGGGSDMDQRLIARDLKQVKGPSLKEAVEKGLVLLSICGGYQLLGQYFKTAKGEVIEGIGLFNAWTEAGDRRLIGNVIVRLPEKLNGLDTLVGFENHSGKTWLGEGTTPLGKVERGGGNNGEDGWEGIRYKNAFGTYLHGPLLPKNPHFTDLLLTLALTRKYGEVAFPPLDDSLERKAHQAVIDRWHK